MSKTINKFLKFIIYYFYSRPTLEEKKFKGYSYEYILLKTKPNIIKSVIDVKDNK